MTKKEKKEKEFCVTEYELLEMIPAIDLDIEKYKLAFEKSNDNDLAKRIKILTEAKNSLERMIEAINN